MRFLNGRELLFLVAAVFLVTSCRSVVDDGRVEELLADPAASLSIPGAELVEQREEPSIRSPLGVTLPTVTSFYRVDGHPNAVFAAAVSELEEAGWPMESRGDMSAVGFKELPSARASATVQLSKDQTELVLVLQYRQASEG